MVSCAGIGWVRSWPRAWNNLTSSKRHTETGKNWFDFSTAFASPPLRALLSQREVPFTSEPVNQRRVALARSLGLDEASLAVPQQVHSARVQIARRGGAYPDTDGMFSNDPGVVLTLRVADCAPVYFYHAPSSWRGLVHAGWRGLASGIITAGAHLLADEGIPLDQVQVVIGPAIQQACYEVGPEVADRFPESVRHSSGGGSFHLNVTAAIVKQLEGMGVSSENITTVDICTRCDPRCHSYRRDEGKAGRMVALFFEEPQIL